MNNEIKEYLIDNVNGRTCLELATIINNKFGTNYKASSIKHYKRKYNLKSGLDTRFSKNRVPYNKKENGYEFIDKNSGYTYIKVSGEWVQKHRYLYEQAYGKIEKGKSVAFADQNKNNFELDNLICIDDRDKLVMKNKHLFTTNADLTKTGVLIAKLSNKCYDKKVK